MDRFEKAAQILGMTIEEAKLSFEDLPEDQAMYFWNPLIGGGAVIIGEDGDCLFADSSIGFEDHIAEYKAGKRSAI